MTYPCHLNGVYAERTSTKRRALDPFGPVSGSVRFLGDTGYSDRIRAKHKVIRILTDQRGPAIRVFQNEVWIDHPGEINEDMTLGQRQWSD
jgi:hypothetical protein